ncbi:DUF459 domain-containing protein [Rhabdothermincola sediminis]|uniref:DUF459 domain-containing protein n=1 Tax=Rhabdothermincola sediminis TaxID=2751370 RepID=UPI001AA034EE|nr:DUF459 domain-containing protein [Rhabdothermincola sediminis]
MQVAREVAPSRGSARSARGGADPSLLARLLRGQRPERPGTMPAGIVLVVVVVGLLLAALLNADATLRKSKARGDGFRQHVAQAVADVSDAVGLSGPRNALDEALGRRAGGGPSYEELLAQKEATEAESGPATTAPPVLRLRTPTPADPLKLWVGGDSVGGSFGVQMQPIADSTGLFKSTLDYQLGTGLIRPDYFNWPEHFAKDVLPGLDPDVVVVMFGANDDQNLELEGGRVVKKYTPEWYAEYRRRVGATMDLLKSPDNDRLVVWVGAVPAGPGSQISNMDVLNYIYWTEAQTRPWVTYVDTFAILGGPDHVFAKEVTYADGKLRGPYQKDNLHLSTWGAQRLSWATLAHIGRFVDLGASKVPNPPPSETAPAEVVEREELPRPENMPDGV